MPSPRVCPSCGGPVPDSEPAPALCPACRTPGTDAFTLGLPAGEQPGPVRTITGGDVLARPSAAATLSGADVLPTPEPPADTATPAPHPHTLTGPSAGATGTPPVAVTPVFGEFPPAVGRFVVRAKLGEGAFGEVFRAYDPQLDREVALKVAKPGDGRAGRLVAEAKAVAGLRHPHVVPVFDAGTDAGRHFIASAFVEGRTLADEVRAAGGPVAPRRAAAVVRQLAGALAYAHGKGVVHRDVKPANVIVDAAGDPHLLDFGLASRAADRPGHEGVVGTPAYMSPEQADGRSAEATAASDQYALGVMLFEMLTGRRPFEHPDLAVLMFHHVNTAPPRPRAVNPRVPRDLEAVCLKCLEKSPAARYPNCEALADDLRRWQDGEPVSARRPGMAERAAKWCRRNPAGAGVVAAGLLAVAAGVTALVLRAEAANARAEVSQKETEEQRRRGERVIRITALERDAGVAAKKGRWQDVVRDTTAALELAAGDPGLADFPPLGEIRALRDEARGQLATARERDAERAKLTLLRDRHADAAYYGAGFNGLEPAENAARVRAAVTDALKVFGDADPDRRFFSPAERARILDRTYELLLLDAAAGAPVPGEPDDARRNRARAALATLDRADALLGAAGPSRGGLLVRADLLAAAGDEAGAEKARTDAESAPAALAADRFHDALAAYRRNDFTRATAGLAALLREHPDHLGAEYPLAVCRVQQKQYAAAVEGADRLLAARPDFARGRLLRGFALQKLGRWAEARADFDAVLEKPPDPPAGYVARVNRGALAFDRQDWAAAAADFRAAVAADPARVTAYQNLALTLRRRADEPAWAAALGGAAAETLQRPAARQEAVAVLDSAAGRRPDAPQVYHERGRLHLLLGDGVKAEADFRKAVTLGVGRGVGSTLADDLVELGRLLHRGGKPDAAERAYLAAAAVQPANPLPWRLAAQSRLALGRYADAAAAIDKFLEAAPVTPGKPPTPEQAAALSDAFRARGLAHAEAARAFRTRGDLHATAADLRAAVEAYTRGLGLARDPETLSLRGWAYLLSNATELALADFDEAVKLNPGLADAVLGRANARAKAGRVAAALADAEAGLAAAPPDARAYFVAARVYAQAGSQLPDPSAAGDALRRAGDLVAKAVAATPPAGRRAFWDEYVSADKAFDPLRRSGRLAALAPQ